MSFYESKAEQNDYFYFIYLKKESETPPHFHGAIEFLFCVEGAQSVSIGGNNYTLRKGDACFIDSYTVHSLTPSGATLYAIVGSASFFQPIFSAFHDSVPPCLFRFEDVGFLSLLYSLYQKPFSSAAADTQRNGALVKLLLAQLHECIPFTPRKENKQNDLVTNILQYGVDHFTEDLSLETIAKKFGYSHTHLSRILHRYLNMNWNIYVGNIRCHAAHTLLQSERDATIAEIAFRCGFESLNTFYRAYHRLFGELPVRK